MTRTDILAEKIRTLYETKHPGRADWADYLVERHVFAAAEYARQLAERYGVKNDLPVAAAMLHDVADAVMKRKDPAHHERTFEIARQLLVEAGFTEDEVAVVVDDAIRFHSCTEGACPVTPEGKVMAAADALAHLCTDFYDYGVKAMKEKGEPSERIKAWGLEKIERDYRVKLSFEEVREEIAPEYGRLRSLFQSLG